MTGVLHRSIFCIKIRSLPDLTISWSKNLIFSDKVLIAFKKVSVNFWGIILCLRLRINNPSKFCMSQLYIVAVIFLMPGRGKMALEREMCPTSTSGLKLSNCRFGHHSSSSKSGCLLETCGASEEL